MNQLENMFKHRIPIYFWMIDCSIGQKTNKLCIARCLYQARHSGGGGGGGGGGGHRTVHPGYSGEHVHNCIMH